MASEVSISHSHSIVVVVLESVKVDWVTRDRVPVLRVAVPPPGPPMNRCAALRGWSGERYNQGHDR